MYRPHPQDIGNSLPWAFGVERINQMIPRTPSQAAPQAGVVAACAWRLPLPYVRSRNNIVWATSLGLIFLLFFSFVAQYASFFDG